MATGGRGPVRRLRGGRCPRWSRAAAGGRPGVDGHDEGWNCSVLPGST